MKYWFSKKYKKLSERNAIPIKTKYVDLMVSSNYSLSRIKTAKAVCIHKRYHSSLFDWLSISTKLFYETKCWQFTRFQVSYDTSFHNQVFLFLIYQWFTYFKITIFFLGANQGNEPVLVLRDDGNSDQEHASCALVLGKNIPRGLMTLSVPCFLMP